MSAATVIATIDSTKVAKQLIDELLEAGFKGQDVEILDGDEDDARGYARATRQGRVVVAARAPEQKVDQTVGIMERYEGGSAPAGEGAEAAGETLQEVEEQLAIHKGKAVTGGVRVTTHVRERPVEQTVTLREEQVEVERRPAGRTLKPEEAEAAFQDKTVEMLGTSEEASVRKQARVVGEVALGKRVEEHKEKVKDTVRRSEVEVETIKPGSAKKR